MTDNFQPEYYISENDFRKSMMEKGISEQASKAIYSHLSSIRSKEKLSDILNKYKEYESMTAAAEDLGWKEKLTFDSKEEKDKEAFYWLFSEGFEPIHVIKTNKAVIRLK
jgi:hypothetical protein